MKRRVVNVTLLIIIAIGIVSGLLFIFIPSSKQNQLSAVCRVEGNACYALALNANDTLYLSLRNDSLQTADIHNHFIDDDRAQSGTFVSNSGHLITSDAIVQGHADYLTSQQLHARLLALDSLMAQRLKTLKAEQDELDEYAHTHSVIDDGYNDVMAYRVKVTLRAEQADTTLKRIKHALQLPHAKAQLTVNVMVNNAYMQRQPAHIEAHRNGLLLLQLQNKFLPKGCHRFSIYRWGARSLRSRLFAFNDLGSKCQLVQPTITDSDRELFEAAEGGAWVNRSGHISGIQRYNQRVSSYKIAQLMRSAHAWPIWWWHNLMGWYRSVKNSAPIHSQSSATTKARHCQAFAVNDTTTYKGLTSTQRVDNHAMRQGYGVLTYASGRIYMGYWHNDSLKNGKCITAKGIYEGDFDAQGRFDGQGTLWACNGEVYSGEWKKGTRMGHGFSSRSKHMVRCGSWRNGRFQGERMVYTADRIYGIDLSRHQHEKGTGRRVKKYGINWSQLRISSLGNGRRVQGTVNYPVSYVYIKATEGRSLFNKYYPNDLRQARKHGIAVGSYHFFTTSSTGAQQADHFLRMAWIANNDLPPVLDLEPTDAQIHKLGGDAALFRQVLIWLHKVEQKHHKRPVLYVGQLFVNNHLKHAPAELRNYDVWIARYGEFKPYVKLLHWQLTPNGRVRGIQGEVDINVFNGTKEAFRKYRQQ